MSNACSLRPPVLAGKYALMRKLGAGTSGSVYEAENLLIGRRVAVKLLSPSFAARADLRAAVISEARIAARIDHPNVVDIRDIGLDSAGVPFIVMELLEGETLAEILAARGPLPLPYACELMLQVLGALAAAHREGIIHRDLKPANVMVTHLAPDRPEVKVLDFGISEGLVEGDHGNLGASGTPLYMPPEQALGLELDERADLYSACAVFYEMLTGEPPFGGLTAPEILQASLWGKFTPLGERLPDLPRALADAIDGGLSAYRGRRPANAMALSRIIGEPAEPTRSSGVRCLPPRPSDPIGLVPRVTAKPEPPPVPPAPRVAVIDGPPSSELASCAVNDEAAEELAVVVPKRGPWLGAGVYLVGGFSIGAALCWWLASM